MVLAHVLVSGGGPGLMHNSRVFQRSTVGQSLTPGTNVPRRLPPGTFLIGDAGTAGINRSNTAARAVLKQPCLTGGRTDTVRPKREPTGLSDPPAGALVGQCLSDHQSNTAVRAPLKLPCSTA
ncbi:hypothetical protein PCANC_06934 [Puccinia coronata f. sp. avenae]|uniref:Uncharacterized protein n=1 Tax=Puccinia coronata f. sp. avenae TaxID=200324 RepID=A0A2N5RV20_9BASI|nr:hypothetical protein PCANC_28366 [Puccinia coronata f. sp. avenae]PLW50599.1 hypothetical protein PCANC_06934 [Puccinia coronata f. sp. avenae]